jgi:hypothetical protein
MALTQGQISLTRPDGTVLLMHHGTPYSVKEFDLFDRGVRANQTGIVPWGDGEWSGAEFQSGVPISLTVRLDGGDWAGLMELWWEFEAAFKSIGTEIRDAELRFNAGGTEYLMYVRPRGAKRPNKNVRTGKVWAEAKLYALNPAIYSAEEFVTEVGLYRLHGGLTVPFTVPFVMYSAVADGVVELTNSGTAESALVITVPGPVREPYFTVTGPDGVPQTLYLDIVLEDGDHLDIDTGEESVVLNDSVSKLHTAYGTWPMLAPRSTSTVQYRASDLTDSRATIRHRWTY